MRFFSVFLIALSLAGCSVSDDRRLQELVVVDQNINEALHTNNHNTGAVRTSVVQFHTGPKDFAAKSEIVFSEQYVAVEGDHDIELPIEMRNDIPFAKGQQFIRRAYENGRCASFINEDLELGTLERFFMDNNNVTTAIVCPLTTRNEDLPMGFTITNYVSPLSTNAHTLAMKQNEQTRNYVSFQLEKKRELNGDDKGIH